MSVAKIIEITSESSKGFEDAVQQGVKRAAETVNNVQAAWVKDQECFVKDGKITGYRVNLKVTFILE